jgi:GNAT superfamily N-acetyltransferase
LDQPPLVAALAVARSRAPAGITIRAWRERADYDAMIDVFTAARRVDGTSWDLTADAIDADVRGFGFRPEQTILLAEAAGQLVGWARGFDFGLAPDDGRMLTHSGHVLPAWRRQGIGRALLAGAQTEMRRIRAERADPPGTTAGFHAWIFASNRSTIDLLESDGYRPHRFVVEMTRSLDDLPAIALPEGLTTRPVEAADRDAILRALDAAMHDHRGWPEMTEDQLRGMFDHPTRGQTDVWQVAWAGDRVVGGVLGYIDAAENAAMNRRRGYTESIFTIREWRGRGVAGAMIARNLRFLRDRGMTEAALSVDTGNPTGALGLYEQHGFREHERVIVFRKELEPAG